MMQYVNSIEEAQREYPDDWKTFLNINRDFDANGDPDWYQHENSGTVVWGFNMFLAGINNEQT